MIGRVPLPQTVTTDDIAVELLFSERLHVVAGATSPWAKKRKVGLADLAAERWTLPPADSLAGSLAREAFAAENLREPQATIVSFSLHLRKAVTASANFTVLHDWCCASAASDRAFAFCRWRSRSRRSPWPGETLKARTLLPSAAPFMACVREVTSSLHKAKTPELALGGPFR